MGKENCWAFKGCGRERGGFRVAEWGVCPAATTAPMHGVHGGTNGGRACWVVAGTLCGGEVQGDFARKESNCLECDFYASVRAQEGPAFVLSGTLLDKLEGRG